MRAALSVLLTATLVMAVMAFASCKGSSDDARPTATEGEAAPTQAPPPPSGGGNASRVAALEEAWNASADCQLLSRCCAGLAGTSWEQTLQPFCQQVHELQNFEQQVENMVDPSWQSNDCRNRAASLAGMGNSANPLPAACMATP